MRESTKERVLVVDDETQVLVALEDLLADDFLVVKSESAEAALNLATGEPDIAVVISDQRMPRMTGDEFFAHLDGRSEAARILVTGFADLTAVVRAVNKGRIFGYVTKPWNPDDLRLMVHKGADYYRLARELANERQLLHDLMDNVPDGISFKDAELRFLRANKVYASLLDGRAPHELAGRTLAALTNGDAHSAQVEVAERRILRDGKPEMDVVREYDRQGRKMWVSESKAPVRGPAGGTIGLVSISRDVTARVTMEDALRTSEERLALTFQGSAAGLFDWDVLSGDITFSTSFGALLGYAEPGWSESLQAVRERIHAADLPRVRDAMSEHFQTRKPFNNLELRLRDRTGAYLWFLASGQAVWDGSRRVTRLAGSIIDITDRKEKDERIARLTRIHALLGAMSSAIVRTSDQKALIRESCRIAVDVGELALAAVVHVGAANAVRVLAWERPDDPYMREISALYAERGSSALVDELVATRKPLIYNDLNVSPAGPSTHRMLAHGYQALAVFPLVVADRVEFALALFSEHRGFFDSEEVALLTELAGNIGFALEHVAQAERLNFLAYHDGLTRLPNRELLADRLTQRIATVRANERLALLLLDISRFGHVNETVGRRGGDRLLVAIADRLRLVIASPDMLARFHGNTFAMLVGSVEDEPDVLAMCIEELIQLTLQESFTIEGTELQITARTGIALYRSDGEDADTLLRNAEAALRNAKTAGQRHMFYAPNMNSRVAERFALEAKLRRAIDREQFLLHYQPKVDLRTGSVVGLEALIRWKDPDVGLVAPGHFIPVLEDTGLIVEVGKWVFSHAAGQYAAWRNQGLKPPRIAVNVSAIQMAQKDFVDWLVDSIRRQPLASEGLDLEITESVFVEDMTGNAEKLKVARANGLRVAIDDFGTGYSSLGYLSRLPIDALKVDRSFVNRMLEDPQDTAIVTTIISLARALELKVIAEGVETLQQAQLLRLLKCDEAQGYLASKPRPAEEIAPLLGATLLKLSESRV